MSGKRGTIRGIKMTNKFLVYPIILLVVGVLICGLSIIINLFFVSIPYYFILVGISLIFSGVFYVFNLLKGKTTEVKQVFKE